MHSLICFTVYILTSLVLGVELLPLTTKWKHNKNDLGGLEECEGWYIFVFLLRNTIVSVVVMVGTWMGYGQLLYCMVGLQLIYILLMVLKRPYSKSIHMVGMLMC
jgi:hypothetical protein